MSSLTVILESGFTFIAFFKEFAISFFVFNDVTSCLICIPPFAIIRKWYLSVKCFYLSVFYTEYNYLSVLYKKKCFIMLQRKKKEKDEKGS